MHRFVVIAAILASAAYVHPAWSQIYTPITELGHTADLIAFATIESASTLPGAIAPDATLSVSLRLEQVLKGNSPSQTIMVTLAERCGSGGRGRGSICVSTAADAPVVSRAGLWFLKYSENGYQILPRHKSTHQVDELFLPVDAPSVPVPATNTLDDTLLACHVRWIQSLTRPVGTFEDERFFTAFAPWTISPPTQRQVLDAIAPLIASPSSWQHAVGLVIALRAGSAQALSRVIEELPTLQSNPRFPEIVDVIGQGIESPGFIAPLRQLISLHADVSGLDTAAAGALYRIGTEETWPLIATLLDSKDPNAQMIAVRTIAIRVPANLATDQTHRFYPGTPGPPLTTEDYVAFWRSWWRQNRATLGYPTPLPSANEEFAPGR